MTLWKKTFGGNILISNTLCKRRDDWYNYTYALLLVLVFELHNNYHAVHFEIYFFSVAVENANKTVQMVH